MSYSTKYIALLLCVAVLLCSAVLPVSSLSYGTADRQRSTTGSGRNANNSLLRADTPEISDVNRDVLSLSAQASVLMDGNTGEVLYSENASSKLPMASTTKIMTALIALEHGNIDAEYTVPAAAVGIEGSSVYLVDGEKLTMKELVYALMLESANEMALAIGEEVSGSVKKFVELMNARAQQLGCTNTHFNNPNGLPDETHVTTANDMAKIAKAAWQNATCRKFFTTDLYEIPPTNVFTETRYLLNHHKMMAGRDYAYDGVLGGKTGYTDAAGATLVTYAKRGNMLLVAVVMNSVNGAWSDTKSLLDYGFDNFERQRIKVSMNPVPKENLPSEQYLLNNCGNTYPFYYTKNIYVTVPIGTDVKTLTRKQRVLSNAVGPLRLKSKYYFNGQMVGWGMQYERNVVSDLLLQTSS